MNEPCNGTSLCGAKDISVSLGKLPNKEKVRRNA